MTLQTFAAAVKAAAAQVPAAGRVGAVCPKVWVHAAWAVGQFDLTLPEFKALLAEANRLGLLSLSRCDQVEAFDRRDVRRSMVEADGATFNFVRV
jgi:hypothetical protein